MRRRTKYPKSKSYRVKARAAARARLEAVHYDKIKTAKWLDRAGLFEHSRYLPTKKKLAAMSLLDGLVDAVKLSGKIGENRKDSFEILCSNLLKKPLVYNFNEPRMVRLSVRPSAWTKKEGRMAGQFVREIIPVMKEHGLIETKRGYQGMPGHKGKVTRIWPTEKFLDYLLGS